MSNEQNEEKKLKNRLTTEIEHRNSKASILIQLQLIELFFFLFFSYSIFSDNV